MTTATFFRANFYRTGQLARFLPQIIHQCAGRPRRVRATMAPPPPDAWADLPVFEKDLYMEHPAVTARSEAETRAFRAATGITKNSFF